MKRKFFLNILLSISSFFCIAQTAQQSNRFWEIQSGFKYHTTLDEFNSLLLENNYPPFNNFGITGSLYRGYQIEKFSTSINFNLNTILNDKDTNRIVRINEGSIIIDASYNFLKKATRIEPVIGIGLGTATLKFTDIDTSVSINALINGENNTFRRETKINLIIKTGIKVGFTNIPFEGTNLYPQIQIGYLTNLSTLKWNISNLPIKKLNGGYAQIGLVKFF